MALKIINVTKSFEDKVIFKSFSYEFKEKGLYILSGRSGVGKTTLLRMISGLDKDYEGDIVGAGIENTSVAFQEYRLFPMLSAIDKAVIPSSSTRDAAIVKKAKDFLNYLGFSDSDLRLKPHELSGGMKQRVSLVRALVRKAPILLLDEPTKELDGELKEKVRDLIHKESISRLVILVTHDREEFNFDSIIDIVI